MTNKVGHFCSGGGTTAGYVAEKANNGELGDIESKLVIVSKNNIGAIEKAEKLGIPWKLLINPNDSKEILQILEEHDINIASGNGYLKKFLKDLIEKFEKKGGIFLNQHPGILRADHKDFGGKGMYGARVMASRILYIIDKGLEGDEVFTESIVHKVDSEYDTGKAVSIVKLPFADEMEEFRGKVGISSKDLNSIDYASHDGKITQQIIEFTKSIQEILLEQEHKNVASVFKRIGNGENPLKEDHEYNSSLGLDLEALDKAKKRAFQLFPKG